MQNLLFIAQIMSGPRKEVKNDNNQITIAMVVSLSETSLNA